MANHLLLSIAEVLDRSVALIAVSDTPRLDVEVLLCHILQKDRAFLYGWSDQLLSLPQQKCFDALFERRMLGEPIAYLTGLREFWSLPFYVSPATLIPRPETELLVELVLSLSLPESASVLDLGTGSGAIALAIASERAKWKITATDTVLDTVSLAKKNRQQLGFNQVNIFHSHWFSGIGDTLFDAIVSNPPYVDPDAPHLAEGDVRFEPKSALVADDHGLSDLRTIIFSSPNYLRRGGWLLLEHGYDQARAVRGMMLEAGFSNIATHSDLAELDRVSLCSYPRLGTGHREK